MSATHKAGVPTPDEFETVTRHAVQLLAAIETQVLWPIRRCLSDSTGDAPALADLGALWSFDDMMSGYLEQTRGTLAELRALMPPLDDLRAEAAESAA